MIKILTTGFLWSAFLLAEGQVWKPHSDSLSGISEAEWMKTVDYLIQLDHKAKNKHSIIPVLDYLTTIYSGDGEVINSSHAVTTMERKTQSDLLKFIADLAIREARHGNNYCLKGLTFAENIPFNSTHYSAMIPALVHYYDQADQTDSALYTVDVLKTRKSFKTTEWEIFFAGVYQNHGRSPEALQTLKDAKAKVKKPDIVNASAKIDLVSAQIYNSAKSFDQSEKILKKRMKSLNLNDPSYSAIHLSLSLELITTFNCRGKFQQSLEVAQQYIDSRNRVEKSSDADVLQMRNKKASTYLLKEDYHAAITEYEGLIKDYQRIIAETNPTFIQLLNQLGQTYLRVHDYHRAYVYFRWGYEMMIKNVSYLSSEAIDINTFLAEVYTSRGDAQAAAYHTKEAEEIRSQVP